MWLISIAFFATCAPVAWPAEGSEPPIVQAARNGDRRAVVSLLEGGADVNAARGDGSTALFWAVHRDAPELLDLLLRAGARVDAADENGDTPLLIACDRGNLAAARRLLEARADPNARRWSGETPLLAAVSVGPADAQLSVGVGVDYLGYEFDEGLGAEAAQLLMVPVGVRVSATDAITLDVSGAWAEGRIEAAGSQLELSGFVDTAVRLAWQATPWGLLTVGANIPTGDSQHDSEEAIVASLLSTDLLGFREASWGRGLAVTSSLAVARSIGAALFEQIPEGPHHVFLAGWIFASERRMTVSGRIRLPGCQTTISLACHPGGFRVDVI